MIGWRHSRVRLVLMIALCAVWAGTPLIAALCAGSATHCERHMPCCPPGSSNHSCTPYACPAETSQRAVKVQVQQIAAPVLIAVLAAPAAMPAPYIAVRETTAGLYFEPAVFRLKDDLRI